MLIPFGILSAAGVSAAPTGAYELISTTILGSGATSVTFSNLGDYSTIYKHLQVRTVVRSDRAGLNRDLLGMRLNGDSGLNYKEHILFGDGSTVYSVQGGDTDIDLASYPPAATATANQFAAYITDILDAYSTTKNKTVRTLSTGQQHSTGSGVALSSGLRINTSSITSITLLSGTGSNLVTGSRFSLYGIKG